MNVKYLFIVSIVWFSPTNKNLFGIRHVLLFILVFFAFSEEGDAKSLQSHWKNPHFEYAFSYFQQMVRDAVDGRTINVVLPKLRCCTMGLKSVYLKKHKNYSSATMAERAKVVKHSQLMSELVVWTWSLRCA